MHYCINAKGVLPVKCVVAREQTEKITTLHKIVDY